MKKVAMAAAATARIVRRIRSGPSPEIGTIASGIVQDPGHNLATGVTEMSIRLRQ